MEEERMCIVCGAIMVRRTCESKKYFATKKYCSSACFGIAVSKPKVKGVKVLMLEERQRIASSLHGDLSSHPLYNAWKNMRRRCDNPKTGFYKNYGGRGISVCDDWKNSFNSFLNWALNNGWQEGLTLDRIDNEGDYAPDNCQWITRSDQLRNRRNNRYVTFNGRTKVAADWAERLGLSYSAFLKRLNKWGDSDRVILEPIHENQRRHSVKEAI